jgi:group I intron endonuclease
MEKFVVYQHRRKDTDEVFYVGIGRNNRPYSKNGRNSYWNRIVKKTDYDIEILYEIDTWIQCCIIEIMLIEKYGRRDKGLGTLVNMTDGGDGSVGYKHSKKHKIKVSQSYKGQNNPFFNKKHNKQFLNKLSKINTGENNPFFGKKHTPQTKNKLSEIDRKGSKNNSSILTEESVIWIRKNYIPRDKEFGMTALSKKFNVSFGTIDTIIRRVSWKHI